MRFQKGHRMNLGKHHSEETKRKISKSRKGVIPNISSEGRKRMSENTKRLWADPEHRKKMSERHTGENSWRWKGDDVDYGTKHDWVQYHYGSPRVCWLCGSTERKMYHWHNISREYKRDISDWIRVCVPCHHKIHHIKERLTAIRSLQAKQRALWRLFYYGSPRECWLCGSTERKMYHWHNISREYKRDISDWIRVCVPCHHKIHHIKERLTAISWEEFR